MISCDRSQWQTMVSDLIRNRAVRPGDSRVFTDWEKDFIEDLNRGPHGLYDKYDLSDRKWACLSKIWRKVFATSTH